jgi:arylsulfatase A-like enzyme
LIAKLAELGRSDSTLIILTSDHGEEFKDHGSMGHKSSLFAEQVRVPLIVSHPKRVAVGQRIEAPVSGVDIMPTILELLGRPPFAKAQGASLVPYLQPSSENADPPAPRHLFSELGPLGVAWEGSAHLKAVRNERHDLIVSYDPASKRLFDRVDDPLEKKDLYEAKKETSEIRDLQAQLDKFVRDGLAYNAGFREKNQIDIDEQTRERLRALGYMD